MISSCTKRSIVLRVSLPLALLFTCLVGCTESNGKKSGGGQVDRGKTSSLNTKLTSPHYFLGVGDLEKFRPGRPKRDILKDIQWRGYLFMASTYKGKSVCAIFYVVLSNDPSSGGEGVWAIFVDSKFAKFVECKRDMEVVDYHGTPRSRPKPIKMGNISWLIRAMETEPVNIADLKKEVKALTPPSSQIDPGLTAAYLLLKIMGKAPKSATEDDYKKNAELRDQFNAARLKIGMTEAEVESVLKAKPLESGNVEADSYKIYGSNESLNVNHLIRFSNILIIFKKGRVSVIHDSPADYGWRRKLGELFIDLPPE